MWTVLLTVLAVAGMAGAGLVLAPQSALGIVVLTLVSMIVGSWAVLIGRALDGR